jgi:hypothetical protein
MENKTKNKNVDSITDDYEQNINFIPINSSFNGESLMGNTTITQLNIENINEQINDTKILESKKGIIYQLCMLKGFDELTELLKLMANSRSLSFLNKEFRDGITCLRDAKMLYELYEILELNFKSHKTIDENFLISSILLFSYEYQERLIILILEKNIKFQSFFYSKLIDSLVKENQILSAANIFFLFNFNYSDNQYPDMNLFIEKLISNNLFPKFYAKFRELYLLNEKAFYNNKTEYQNKYNNYVLNKIEPIETMKNYDMFNKDLEYSYYNKDEFVNNNDNQINRNLEFYIEDDEINNIIEAISCKLQKNLRLNKKASSKELKEILLEKEKSCDLIPSEDGSDNLFNNNIFYKNKILEEIICNALLQEISKKM